MVAESGRPMPGAAAALDALAAVPGVVQSLLTGNVRQVAEVKLAPLGLMSRLDLEVGAYGNEHEIRAELVRLARHRAAAAYDADFSGALTVLVGDTPLDIEAALATGARAVGVATGQFTLAELLAANPHAALEDLSGTPEVVAAVLGDARGDLGPGEEFYQPRPA